jgi:hypothetical protein
VDNLHRFREGRLESAQNPSGAPHFCALPVTDLSR